MEIEPEICSKEGRFWVEVTNYGRGKRFEPKYMLRDKDSTERQNTMFVRIRNINEVRELHDLLGKVIRDAERRDKRYRIVPVKEKPAVDRFASLDFDGE